MRAFSSRSKVWIYDCPVDMRNGYNGLSGYVSSKGQNVLNGDIYLFISRNRKRVKVLFWDGSGLNIWMKRMEEGQFANVWLRGEMTMSELKLFFEGSTTVIKRLSPEKRIKKYVA
jgi:transposase